MHCPYCSHEDTKVLESRITPESKRRRRECLKCSNRFTTHEKAIFSLTVQKKSGLLQPYNVEKISQSIARALGKVDDETLLTLTRKVEQKVLRRKVNPIKSSMIGKAVLQELKKINKVAYVRFASIHKGIDDPKQLEAELSSIA